MSRHDIRRAEPAHVFAGAGSDVPCDYCGMLILEAEVEYEVECEVDGGALTLHLHQRCYAAWRSWMEATR